ncbi:MAG TPA: response regulator [Longimicrobiales bacterium]|nr:response regulator [Longimicrobiales bacterium]
MARKTIVMVEDNPDNRRIYSILLEHSGYEVVQAEDAESGIALVSLCLPDLVLMDISLPRMDGFEATARLKDNPITAGIPVVALTAHAFDEDRRRAWEVGFDGYLTKPVAPRRVLEVVERFLGRDVAA